MRNIIFIVQIYFITILFCIGCSVGPVIVNMSKDGILTYPQIENTSTKTTDVSPNTNVPVNGGTIENSQQKTNETETKK